MAQRVYQHNQRFPSQVSEKYESTWPKGYTNIAMQNTVSVDGFDAVTNHFRHMSQKNTRVHGLEGIPT